MQQFRASINLLYDLPDAGLLDRYLLTSMHAQVLRGLFEGVARRGSRAHLLIGPYGTGKSLLSTIACQWLSRSFSPEWRGRLVAQAKQIDTQLATVLQETEREDLSYLPVLINGKTGSLRSIINQAVHLTLRQHDVEIVTPNEAVTILEAVDRWKSDYPVAYEAFLEHLTERDVAEPEWREQIKEFQEEPTRAFVEFYPSATSGTAWTFGHEAHFIDNLELILSQLAVRGLGLFIVYDEFGRFLQSLGGADTLENMQDLQNLAEFVDRADNVHLLVVGHKHIRQYAALSRESIRGEFEKVEKRFRFYSLDNDSATFLRLAQEAIADTNARYLDEISRAEEEQIPGLAEILRGYPLFVDYTAYQLELGIIRQLAPLHPVAFMLLPHLSNIFGQNERTLFSFLSDDGLYSVRDHSLRQKGCYYADQLFDFFRVDEADRMEVPNVQLYQSIAPFLDDKQPIQHRIAKLLTLWSVSRLSSKQPMTTEFAALALGLSVEITEETLERLARMKVVRYNAIRELWELYDGSSLDLNAVVADRLGSTSLQGREALALLERHLPQNYIMPYEYNDQMDMLRYADICFATIADLRSFDESLLTADDRVWLVLYEDMDDKEDPDRFMEELSKPLLAAFPSFSTNGVQELLLQFKVMDQLSHDPVFLAQDSRLKNELAYMSQEVSARIRAFVDRYFKFKELIWMSGTESRIVKNLYGLERIVTDRLQRKYQNTPRIPNEAFNRTRISSIQRRALVDVIDRIIQSPTVHQLGIEGFGPNYLIYASALKKHGYAMDNEGQLTVGQELAPVRQALLNRLEAQPIGRLSELIVLMKEPPFGIRAAVIPLLFVALLRDRWDQLLFYSHDMLTTHLSGASVLELVELSEAYDYRYYEWSVQDRQALDNLGAGFDLAPGQNASFLHAAEELLRWLRGLPKFAQLTMQLSQTTIRVRDTIRAAETNPYAHLKLLGSAPEEVVEAKGELEGFLDRNGQELREEVLAMTGLSSFAEIGQSLAKLRSEALGKNSKLLTMTDWTDEPDILDRLTEHLVGAPRKDWSDATQRLFFGQLKYEWQLIQVNGTVAVTNDITEAPIDAVGQLSKKSQTLYANVKNMLKYAGRDVPTHEVRLLLVKLLQEIEP